MLDFLIISSRLTKKGGMEIFPKFRLYPKSNDLMIRGGDFYAVWMEEKGLWSTNESDCLTLIDRELDKYVDDHGLRDRDDINVLYTWDSDSGVIDKWHKYCQKQMRDSFVMLDESLIFSNMETKREDYASKRLPYPLAPGSYTSYDKLIGTLYSEDERRKIEWAIGAIVSGDSKWIQKFMVLYGSGGTGKSTILNIIQQLFEGYHSVFDAKALGSASNAFALEAFKTNPLVAIQHDGNLSKIEDNTKLNSLVSHEMMTVNEKFKSTYQNSFKCFLFMGSNSYVMITDSKSGLIRRLIDVEPTGNKLPFDEYKALTEQIKFELGAIAWHCLEVYKEDPDYYNDYVPKSMMRESNDFYNFIVDSYRVFKKEDGTTLKAAWEMYKAYCEEARVPFPFSKRKFEAELKTYFFHFDSSVDKEDGTKLRNYYSGFKTYLLEYDLNNKKTTEHVKPEPKPSWIDLREIDSIFDEFCSNCLAQYASAYETPKIAWDKCKTHLSDIDTSKLHYVKFPDARHIVIDFDIKDESGNKSFEKNLEAASKWPPTYTELSKGGAGIHLHYIYEGDISLLSHYYDDEIEIKIFSGGSSLRRKLTKCNDLPIATISSGLPLKEGGNSVLNFDGIKNERMLRSLIKRHLNKEIMGYTTPSVQMIKKCLDEAYESDMGYDVSDMQNAIYALALSSTNNSDACIKLVDEMKFTSEEPSEDILSDSKDDDIVFFDVEVFPNLFLVNWKYRGEGKSVVRMINPKPSDIEELLRFKLVGFNNRRYDNHMLYARLMGYSNEMLYNLSQKIINSSKGEQNKYLFGEAYNISYTDIYDFASAGNKKSLKKLEIEMGIHHQELGLPWDQPVPEEKWVQVAEYCDNDVIATEAAFNYLSADWTARQILADLADSIVNDTTNNLTKKIIFGKDRKPQGQFLYRNLAEPVLDLDEEVQEYLRESCPAMMSRRHGAAKSLLPYFPGYKYEFGKSTYRGEEVGEGGYVYAEPGMYGNVALLDVASMHPSSIIAECLFGVKYSKAFRAIVRGRVSIKHEAWDEVNNMLDGKLTPYIQKVLRGEMTSKELANALKTAINAVYGQTAARYECAFKDPRNKDNIVAKRGALFMLDLKYEVQKRGFTVVHIKTDSIKIADATPEIIKFVHEFGRQYGYEFEHEATYDRICLVNDAVYIAQYASSDKCQELYGYIPGDNKKSSGEWTATGTQFAVPYVFKKLFSREPIEFADLCETKEVKGAIYIDMNEDLPDVTQYEKEFDRAEDKYKKGKLSDTLFEHTCAELNELIEKGHNYIFVGKVGQFCPIKPGCGGGVLYRLQDNKYHAVTGTTGYRWLETETVTTLGKEDEVDRRYYDALVDAAIDTISKYGDFEWFVSDDPYIPKQPVPGFMNIPEYETREEIPFEEYEELPFD